MRITKKIPIISKLSVSFFTSARLTFIKKFIYFELYHDLASRPFINAVYLGERKKITSKVIAKQAVHSYLVMFSRWQ